MTKKQTPQGAIASTGVADENRADVIQTGLRMDESAGKGVSTRKDHVR